MLHSNASKDRGFTLLESAIVLAIVGILLALGIPSLIAAQNRAKLAQSLDLVVASLQESQREAIRRNKTCNLVFDKANRKIVGDDGCLLSGDRMLPAPIEIDYTGTDNYIRYGIRGNTTSNKSVIVRVKDQPTNSKCLTVSAPLGIIRQGTFDPLANTCGKLSS